MFLKSWPFLTAIGLLLIAACGQQGPTKESTLGSSSELDQDPRSVALRRLLREQSVTGLQALLAANEVESGEIRQLPTREMLAGLAGAESLLVGATQAGKYVIVPVTLSVSSGRKEIPTLLTQAAFVFDERGKFVQQFGGGVSSDGAYGDQVRITSLGAKNEWFIIVMHSEMQDSFDSKSDVFSVMDGLRCAVSLRHELQSLGTSIGGSDDRPPEISFDGGDTTCAFGKTPTGESFRSVLSWDPKNRVFRGPVSLSCGARGLFDVDVQASKAFEALPATGTP